VNIGSTFLFILETISIATISILLFLQKRRFGLSILHIFFGIVQLLYVLLLMFDSTGATFNYLTAALASGTVFMVLLIYISEGIVEARRVVWGLLIALLIAAFLASLFLLEVQLNSPARTSGLNLRAALVGLAILLFDVIAVLTVYGMLANKVQRLPQPAFIALTLLCVFFVDSLFSVAALHYGSNPVIAFRDSLVKQYTAALLYTIALALLLKFRRAQVSTQEAPRFRLLEMLSYRQQYEILREMAIHDELTGLYNRRYFNETFPHELERSRRYNQPLSLAMIDIDHFKSVNDRWGHSTGDAVLKQVAEAFQKNSRDIDLVFRYGGEEFIILLPSTPEQGAIVAMKKLQEAVKRINLEEGKKEPITITISVGLAFWPNEASTGKDLIELADKRLYQAKRKGRDTIVAA